MRDKARTLASWPRARKLSRVRGNSWSEAEKERKSNSVKDVYWICHAVIVKYLLEQHLVEDPIAILN